MISECDTICSGFSKLRRRGSRTKSSETSFKLKHVGKVLRCLLMERLEDEDQDLEINPFLYWQPMKMDEIIGYWIILPLVSNLAVQQCIEHSEVC